MIIRPWDGWKEDVDHQGSHSHLFSLVFLSLLYSYPWGSYIISEYYLKRNCISCLHKRSYISWIYWYHRLWRISFSYLTLSCCLEDSSTNSNWVLFLFLLGPETLGLLIHLRSPKWQRRRGEARKYWCYMALVHRPVYGRMGHEEHTCYVTHPDLRPVMRPKVITALTCV